MCLLSSVGLGLDAKLMDYFSTFLFTSITAYPTIICKKSTYLWEEKSGNRQKLKREVGREKWEQKPRKKVGGKSVPGEPIAIMRERRIDEGVRHFRASCSRSLSDRQQRRVSLTMRYINAKLL